MSVKLQGDIKVINQRLDTIVILAIAQLCSLVLILITQII